MSIDESTVRAQFHVGQIIHHKLFDYRGVVIDVDPQFQGTDDWYRSATRTRPPKDRPWYHVLVDGSDTRTYVAERNLEADDSKAPVAHPEVAIYFERLEGEGYRVRKRHN